MPHRVEHHIEALIRIARKLGYVDMEARLIAERALLASSVCRIAVVGSSGAGKSALINRRFLSEDLLPMDSPTVVPTEIRQGMERRLEIFPYLERAISPMPRKGKAAGVVTALSACEGQPAVITDPSPADVLRHTSAAAAEARERMDAATARARIFLPSPGLEGLILVDTPGISPMTRAAVLTRYRILPACDRVLLVAGAEALSTAERTFLESPAMAGRDIRLHARGAPWTGREAVAPTAAGDRCARLLDDRVDDLAGLARSRCFVELGARENAAAGHCPIQDDLRGLEQDVRIRQERVMVGLKQDLEDLAARVSETLGSGITGAVDEFAAGARGMADGPVDLVRQLESVAAECARQMTVEVAGLALRYESKALDLLEPMEALIRREFGARAVPAVRPSFSEWAMDRIALSRLNPFGLLADILPGIIGSGPLTPVFLARWLSGVQLDMPQRVEAMFRPIAEILPAEWEDGVNSRLAAVRQGISAVAAGPGDPDRMALLGEMLLVLEGLAEEALACRGEAGTTSNRSDP